MKRNQLVVVAVGLLLVVIAVLAVFASQVKPTGQLRYGGKPDRPVPTEPAAPEPEPSSDLTVAACTDAGGTWNDCGSACRAEPEGTVCILMCVQYCECTSDAECPDGYSCDDYVGGTGVCKAS